MRVQVAVNGTKKNKYYQRKQKELIKSSRRGWPAAFVVKVNFIVIYTFQLFWIFNSTQ